MTHIKRRPLLSGAAAGLTSAALPMAGALAQPRRPLRVAVAANTMFSLDPRRSVQAADQFSGRQIFDSLMDPPYGTFDLGNDQVRGELAESWSVSPDARSWTVRLRQGVQFHKNMGELTADDVKYTYDSMLDPRSGSTQRPYLSDLDSVEVVDRYTVRFRLNQPNPTFHASGLIAVIGCIVPRRAAEGVPFETFSRAPIGSGPYEFAGMDPNRGVVLRAFDGYYGEKAKIDTIEMRYMADPTARTLGFLKGDLDIIEGARLPGWVAQIRQQKPDTIFDQTRPGSIKTLYFNMSRRPFDDVRVRRALRYGIDRNVLIQAFGGIAGPSWGINPPDFPGGYTEAELPEELRYHYDPARARALLAEAGLPRGFRFEIIMTQREDYASIMLIVQDMWRRIGVDMSIRTIDHTTYHAEKDKDVNAVVLQSSTFAPVATQIPLAYYHSRAVVRADGRGNQNYSHYGAIGGGGVDALIDQAQSEADLSRRQETIRRAELQILRDMPAFTICTLSFVFARNPRLDLGFDVKAGYARYRLSQARFVA